MYNDSYKQLDLCQEKLDKVEKGFKELRAEVDDTILYVRCMIEVEDFLENGPGGRDPF
jgi:hypothetical protein